MTGCRPCRKGTLGCIELRGMGADRAVARTLDLCRGMQQPGGGTCVEDAADWKYCTDSAGNGLAESSLLALSCVNELAYVLNLRSHAGLHIVACVAEFCGRRKTQARCKMGLNCIFGKAKLF